MKKIYILLLPLFLLVSNLYGQSNFGVVKAAKNIITDAYGVLCTGSWVEGNFHDPLMKDPSTGLPGTSDFDMQVVVKPGTSPDDALKAWKEAKEKLRVAVQSEFTDPADAEKILKKINVYPPSQLLPEKGVKSAEEAMEIFQKTYKTVPALDVEDVEHLTQEQLKKAAEGVYGEGSGAFRQGYQKEKAGMVIYKDGDKAIRTTRNLDLEFGAEGFGKYTTEGSANVSGQFIDKARGAMTEDPRVAAKNIDRLLEESKICRNKSGYKGAIIADEGASILAKVKECPDLLKDPKVREEVEKMLIQVDFQNHLLVEFKNAAKDPARRELIVSLLERKSAASNKLWAQLIEMGGKLPVGKILQGVFIFLIAKDLISATDEKGFFEAMKNAGLDMAMFENAPLFMLAVTNSIIECAKESGYNFVQGKQDCEDLLAGIITIKGREANTLTTKHEYSIQQLVESTSKEETVRYIVENLAREASSRGAGEHTEKADEEVAKVLSARCSDKIVKAWNDMRNLYFKQINDIVEQYLHFITNKPAVKFNPNKLLIEWVQNHDKLEDKSLSVNISVEDVFTPLVKKLRAIPYLAKKGRVGDFLIKMKIQDERGVSEEKDWDGLSQNLSLKAGKHTLLLETMITISRSDEPSFIVAKNLSIAWDFVIEAKMLPDPCGTKPPESATIQEKNDWEEKCGKAMESINKKQAEEDKKKLAEIEKAKKEADEKQKLANQEKEKQAEKDKTAEEDDELGKAIKKLNKNDWPDKLDPNEASSRYAEARKNFVSAMNDATQAKNTIIKNELAFINLMNQSKGSTPCENQLAATAFRDAIEAYKRYEEDLKIMSKEENRMTLAVSYLSESAPERVDRRNLGEKLRTMFMETDELYGKVSSFQDQYKMYGCDDNTVVKQGQNISERDIDPGVLQQGGSVSGGNKSSGGSSGGAYDLTGKWRATTIFVSSTLPAQYQNGIGSVSTGEGNWVVVGNQVIATDSKGTPTTMNYTQNGKNFTINKVLVNTPPVKATLVMNATFLSADEWNAIYYVEITMPTFDPNTGAVTTITGRNNYSTIGTRVR